jgi:hypothetical protein
MGPNSSGPLIREAPTTRFVLDAQHLAMLDRFVARARRQARRRGREFAGVVVEVDPAQPVSVTAADLAPLILGSAAYVDCSGLGGVRDRPAAHTHLRLTAT